MASAIRNTLLRGGIASAFRPAARLGSTQGSRIVARRGYASGSSGGSGPKGSNTALFFAAGAVVGTGAAYTFFNSGSNTETKVQTQEDSKSKSKVGDYQAVYSDVADLLEAEGYDDGSYGPIIVRLAWHSSGTYNKHDGTGGSNGATMRFAPESTHGANAGLAIARVLLERIHDAHPWISYGDLWTLAGVCAVQEMGGPKIAWRAGRLNKAENYATEDGRLPDGSKGQDHLRDIFYRQGFNDQEIVALTGGHALGRCHTDRSGYDGPWTHSPTTMSNSFFQLLLDEKWSERRWKGPKQFQDESSKSLMMLPADVALIKDKEFRKWVELYAKDEEKFFADFSKVFQKLLENGVPEKQWITPEFYLKTTDELSEEAKAKTGK